MRSGKGETTAKIHGRVEGMTFSLLREDVISLVRFFVVVVVGQVSISAASSLSPLPNRRNGRITSPQGNYQQTRERREREKEGSSLAASPVCLAKGSQTLSLPSPLAASFPNFLKSEEEEEELEDVR